jgi:hypothetical protein
MNLIDRYNLNRYTIKPPYFFVRVYKYVSDYCFAYPFKGEIIVVNPGTHKFDETANSFYTNGFNGDIGYIKTSGIDSQCEILNCVSVVKKPANWDAYMRNKREKNEFNR